MNRRRRKRPSLLPFGRTRFFIGAAILFLTVSAITYYLLKDPAGTPSVNMAAPPREPRGSVSSVNAEGVPPVSRQQHAAEKSDVSPPQEIPPPGVTGPAGEVESTAGSVPPQQKTKELPPPSSPGAAQQDKPRPQTVPEKTAEQRTSDYGDAGNVVKHQGGFIIQFGAYSQRATAERAQKTLLAQGAHVTVDNEGSLFKVRVGPFKTREEAEEVANRLGESTGLAFLITKL
jgi:DedD protein